MAECPIWIGDAAVGMVGAAYDKYTEYATKAYQIAVDAVGGISSFTLAPIAINTHWNFDGSLYGFQRPQTPTLPDIEFHDPGTLPALPDLPQPGVTFDSPPSDPNVALPDIRDYPQPGAFEGGSAPDAPVLAPINIPALPDLVLPAVPTLQQLQLPDVPVINLPTFTGAPPLDNLEAPQSQWSFTPEEYTSALLTKVTGQVSTMLDGGTGLPAAVAQALRDRANVQVDNEEARSVQEAVEEFASRGFDEPNGILSRRVAMVRQDAQNRRNSLNRDVFVQEQQVALENLRFAVTQGIALEGQLMQAHTEEMRLALSAAQFGRETAIAIFNAQVSLYNARGQVFAIEAQVWRSQIEGELSKLEAYRAQLDAERLRGEINVQAIQIYSERVRAVGVQADMYRAQMSGAQAQADANRATTEAYRARVQGYAEEVRAYEVSWEAYRAQIGTNETRARVYELLENSYATRVGAWDRTQQGKIAQATLAISQNDLRLRGWHGQLDAILGKYQAERDRVGALVSISGQKVDLYRAQATVESVASDANLRALQTGIERERARTDVELKNAEMQINQLVQASNLLLEAKRTVASVGAQLAASSMSAVNFSAGIRSERQQTQACDTRFNYSGAIDTSTGT